MVALAGNVRNAMLPPPHVASIPSPSTSRTLGDGASHPKCVTYGDISQMGDEVLTIAFQKCGRLHSTISPSQN